MVTGTRWHVEEVEVASLDLCTDPDGLGFPHRVCLAKRTRLDETLSHGGVRAVSRFQAEAAGRSLAARRKSGSAEVVYVAYLRPLISQISAAEPARLPTRLPNATAISRRGGLPKLTGSTPGRFVEQYVARTVFSQCSELFLRGPGMGPTRQTRPCSGTVHRVWPSVGSETVPMVRRLRRMTRKEGLLRGKGGAGRDFAP